jgi:NADH-quinone oxidoreductase subunit M
MSRVSIVAGLAALLAGAITLSMSPDSDIARTIALGAFLLAAGLRSGIFPFQFWTSQAFDSASLPSLNLWLNSHLGVYLLIRFAIPLLTNATRDALQILSMWALVAALYTALLALAESKPRRILGLLYASQTGFLLMGVTNATVQGVTGALISWWVTALAITGLIAVYASLEARTTEVSSPSGLLGLGIHAPRLAIFFVICGLAIAGLPGTLGFAAQDLLVHGSLTAHPWVGFAMPLAEALNAITVLRLFATLFLGRRGIHVPPIPDANVGERWALATVVTLLVAGGIAPVFFISLRAPAAEWLMDVISGR